MWLVHEIVLRLLKTRRERLKSALYLRLKKRKTFFLEKLDSKNLEGGTLLVPPGFVGYLEKVKSERGEPLD